MSTCLLIANQTIAEDALSEAFRERCAGGDATVHLLVPINDNPDKVSSTPAPRGATATVGLDTSLARRVAEQQLAIGLDWLRQLGAAASGEIVTERDIVETAHQITQRQPIDVVIVSTLPKGISRWLRQSLPHKIQRKVDVPVEIISA